MRCSRSFAAPCLNRRTVLLAGAVQLCSKPVNAQKQLPKRTIGLGFGTYGMKSLQTDHAVRVCAEIGYDGIEFALMKGWPTDPIAFSKPKRKHVQALLSDSGLSVPSLLENLPCTNSPKQHSLNCEKLKRAVELAHDLAPRSPPIVQSVVAGKTSQWDESKHFLVDQLGEWSQIGQASQTVVCFKPHANHLVHTPERALWIHEQVDSSWLKIVYDYSHFSLEGLSIESTLRQLLPVTEYVQIKDSRGTPASHEYLLPGDGETDYLALLSTLRQSDYRGFVNVEVSSHVHRKAGYDPIATAKLCYQRMAPLFRAAGIDREN